MMVGISVLAVIMIGCDKKHRGTVCLCCKIKEFEPQLSNNYRRVQGKQP